MHTADQIKWDIRNGQEAACRLRSLQGALRNRPTTIADRNEMARYEQAISSGRRAAALLAAD